MFKAVFLEASMEQLIEKRITELEDRLQRAMLNGLIEELDDLLAPDLVFTNHLGWLLGKQDDLEAYRSGALKITELLPSEQQFRRAGNAFVVSVRMQLRGTYAGAPANGDFRFTRVWAPASEDAWHVVAAHAGLIE
jgi:hypothetical protein